MDCYKDSFAYVDHRIWQMIWSWALRRHSQKSKQRIKDRYFKRHQGRDWTLFDYDDKGKLHTLFMASNVAIKRHVVIKGKANPYDPADEPYFEMRAERGMKDKLKGRRKLESLYQRQKGICTNCQERITEETGWHVHHVIPSVFSPKIDTILPLFF